MRLCSFCGRDETQCRKMFERPDRENCVICDVCAVRFKNGEGFIAHCDSCEAKNGQHDPLCTEREIA